MKYQNELRYDFPRLSYVTFGLGFYQFWNFSDFNFFGCDVQQDYCFGDTRCMHAFEVVADLITSDPWSRRCMLCPLSVRVLTEVNIASSLLEHRGSNPVALAVNFLVLSTLRSIRPDQARVAQH